MSQIGSGTAIGLIEFLDQLVEKGRATGGSVQPLKTAVKQVLIAVEGEDKWQEVDIRNVDVTDYIDRFKNKTVGRYSVPSLNSYKSRLSKAKEWYTTFLVNPGWAPVKNLVVRSVKSATKREEGKPVPAHSEGSKSSNEEAPNRDKNLQNDLIAYPFPLRIGKIVHLYLPLDLTLSEAKRLGRYLESLSVDSQE